MLGVELQFQISSLSPASCACHPPPVTRCLLPDAQIIFFVAATSRLVKSRVLGPEVTIVRAAVISSTPACSRPSIKRGSCRCLAAMTICDAETSPKQNANVSSQHPAKADRLPPIPRRQTMSSPPLHPIEPFPAYRQQFVEIQTRQSAVAEASKSKRLPVPAHRLCDCTATR